MSGPAGYLETKRLSSKLDLRNDERSSRLTASFIKVKFISVAHRREENNVANSMTVCKQHNHSVDTNTQTSGWRQTIFQRSHVIFVIEHGFVVTCSFSVNLFLETFSLIFCVV